MDINVLWRVRYSDRMSQARALSSLTEEKEELQEKLDETVRRTDRRMLALEAELKASETKLDQRTERFTECISNMKAKAKEQGRKHKSALAKKDAERERAKDNAEKKKRRAVSNAVQEGEKRLKLSQMACRRHRKSMEVRPPAPLL